jgi:hypothetical protein
VKKIKFMIYLLLIAINIYLMAIIANDDIDDNTEPLPVNKNKNCLKTGRTLLSEFRYYISINGILETKSTWITKEEYRCNNGKGSFYL